MMNVAAIWRNRLGAFWKEALLYGSYALRGGLGTFILLLFIIGGYFYARWLGNLNPAFPYWRVTTPLFAVAIGASPIRTFLKEADLVFLMPAEGPMKGYFRRSALYSFAVQAACAAALMIIVWPLYIRCRGSDAASFAAILLLLWAAKLVAVAGSWEESRLLVRGQRRCVAAMRWIAAIVVAHAAFANGPATAAAALIACTLVLSFILRFLPRQSIAWTYWLDTEKEQLARRYMAYSWFSDVPKLPKRVKPRGWAAAWIERIPLRQDRTYVYLYGKTFVRSELFGIWTRITLLAAVLLAAFPTDAARLTVYVIAVALSAIQLSALSTAHRHTFWTQLYPAAPGLQAESAARVAAAALLACSVLLGLLLAALADNLLYALGADGLAILFALSYRKIISRRNRPAHELPQSQ